MSLKFVQGHMSMDVCKVLLIIHFRPKYCTDIFSVKYWHDLEIWHSRSLQGFWCAIKSRKWGRPYSRPTFGYKTFLRCSKFLPLLSSVLPSTIAIISYLYCGHYLVSFECFNYDTRVYSLLQLSLYGTFRVYLYSVSTRKTKPTTFSIVFIKPQLNALIFGKTI